ncbi:MAG: ZIP family metal transporter [Putridiphycobacter sp.]
MSTVVQILVLFSSVFLGGLLVALLKKSSYLKLLLSFSGGYLLTIIFTHILPDSYQDLGNQVGFYILGGFLIQLLLEYFSQGAEHGHTHTHHLKKNFPLVIFISLSIHAFIEAIPINTIHAGHAHEIRSGAGLFWGIFLHKVPVAVALMTIFKASGLSNFKAWVFLGVFGLMAPLGLLFGGYLSQQFHFETGWILGLAVGMFLHISTTIIFESSEGHKINAMKLFAIIIGFILGILVS